MKRLVLMLTLALAQAGCVDAQHDSDVSALGGEAPGVREGPLHRAGQPCITCHGGDGPGGDVFSVAGTVYLYEFGQVLPAPGVTVLLEDIDGVGVTIPTNQVGTFYIGASDWQPKYPLKAQIQFGKVRKQMQTVINRAGSCADCHKMDASPTSPGKVYLAVNAKALEKAMQAQ